MMGGRRLEAERRAREEQREFVDMVSHEFRTPLAIINTSIQQLVLNLDGAQEKTLQRASNIRNAISRMNLLLDDYLSTDRLDTTQQGIQLQNCDLYDVIEESVADWPIPSIKVSTKELPTSFVCDPDLLRIALRNLLANAVRHSADGSVVELELSGQPNGSLKIRIQDFGEGIPPDEVAHIYQRYFRGRLSQGKPGAGLGLYLVQRIVGLHGGTVEIQSTLGQGTTFIIQVPRGKL